MLRKFFEGRYGMDNLTMAMLLLSAILMNMHYIWIAGVALAGCAVFRVMSKNIESRKKELQSFDKAAGRVMHFLSPVGKAIAKGLMPLIKASAGYGARLQQRKNYVFVKCKKCKNMLRLPRNKGKLLATCPVCKSEFTIKT